MILKEYRIVLPMTVEEYQVAQLYGTAEASINETGGGEGVKVIKNEHYENVPLLNGQFCSGQYTLKKYFLASKVPGWVRAIVPSGALELQEEAWNAYPYCKTVITNPGYMKENFVIKLETYHYADRGETYNIHQLSEEKLQNREVIVIDIADPVSESDYDHKNDPTRYVSEQTGRGPLKNEPGRKWQHIVDPVMTCYKLITIEFKWWGLQGQMEAFIMRQQRRLLINLHRQIFCSTDKWYGMTMEDIRKLEDKVKEELERRRLTGEVCGTKADN